MPNIDTIDCSFQDPEATRKFIFHLREAAPRLAAVNAYLSWKILKNAVGSRVVVEVRYQRKSAQLLSCLGLLRIRAMLFPAMIAGPPRLSDRDTIERAKNFAVSVLREIVAVEGSGPRSRPAVVALKKIARIEKAGRLSNWLRLASLLLPRHQRERVLGDLLEDIEELRATGVVAWRIWLFVHWQLLVCMPAKLWSALCWIVRALLG